MKKIMYLCLTIAGLFGIFSIQAKKTKQHIKIPPNVARTLIEKSGPEVTKNSEAWDICLGSGSAVCTLPNHKRYCVLADKLIILIGLIGLVWEATEIVGEGTGIVEGPPILASIVCDEAGGKTTFLK